MTGRVWKFQCVKYCVCVRDRDVVETEQVTMATELPVQRHCDTQLHRERATIHAVHQCASPVTDLKSRSVIRNQKTLVSCIRLLSGT